MSYFTGCGYDLHYSDLGKGPTILLGHGLTCDSEMFDYHASVLSKQFRVINVDYPGHGKSGGSPNVPWTLEAIAKDLVALLDHLEIQSAHWVGLSMGAMIALRAALASPDRVKSLVLMNTSAGCEPAEACKKYMLMAETLRQGQIHLVVDTVLSFFFSLTTYKTKPDLVERWKQKLLQVNNPEFLYQAAVAVFNRSDVTNRLSTIKQPTVVIHSEHDRARTFEESTELARGIPSAKLRIIKDAAHLSALEQPKATAELISKHLQDCEK